MQFGMFMEFQTRPDTNANDAFAEGFDLVDAAEAWGLDGAWLAEFHFSPQRSVLSSPIVVASAIASRTQRLRIGMAVYVLPLNNPLRVAEEVATIDHISGGRFDLGVGRSGFTAFYRGYGISYDDSKGRFEEAMEILPKAWSGEVFSYDGKHFQIREAKVWPPPVQQPHPPLRMAATTAATFEQVGRQGLPIFVGLRGDGLETLQASLAQYRTAWSAAGHPGHGDVHLRLPLYAATTESSAIEEARETLVYYFDRQSRMVAADAALRAATSAEISGGPAAPSSADAVRVKTAEKLAALTYHDILASRVVVGSAEGVIERLTVLRDALGLDGVVIETNAGGLLHADQVRESVRVLTHDVMPSFK